MSVASEETCVVATWRLWGGRRPRLTSGVCVL